MKKQDIINLGASLDIPTDDTLLIIQKIMGISSKELFLVYDIDDSYIADIKSAFQQIQSGIPLEYMFGEAEFYGYKFFVNKHTLIPRNDTEILTQKTIEHIKSQAENVSLVDVGTGSGCIGISVYKNLNNKISHTILIDISEQALEVTRKNITLYGYTKNIDTLSGDLFSPLLREPFSNLVVTANLPYIKDNDFDNIDQSVIYHEPHSALFGGDQTGFELYEKLVSQLDSVVSESITLFIEIGFDQADIVRDFCERQKIDFEIYRDNGGVERCVKMKIR